MKTRSKLYIPLIALFILAAVYQTGHTIEGVQQLLYPTELAQSPFGLKPVSQIITNVGPAAQQAGIHEGDILLEVQGRAYTGTAVLVEPLLKSRPGDSLTVRVRGASEGEQAVGREVTIPLAAPKAESPGISTWLPLFVVLVLMPVFCLVLGFWVAAIRPEDPVAWLLLGLMLSFGQLGGFETELMGIANPLRDVLIAYHVFYNAAWPIWMLLFGIYFPERYEPDRRWPWAKWVFIIPLGLITILEITLAIGTVDNYRVVAPIFTLFQPYQRPIFIFSMLPISIFFFALFGKLHATTNPDARRRLRLLTAGTSTSLAPLFILIIVGLVRGRGTMQDISPWLSVPALLLLFLFPLTLAYVIVVHRAMDVRVAIRQGVQYALARNGVRVIQVILSAVIIFVAASLIASSAANRPQKIAVMAVGVALVFLLQGVAEKLRGWVDRRFFREAYNAEQILSDLSEKVRTIVETKPLLETVAERISESLHVRRVALMLRENGSYSPAHALGYDAPPPVTFQEQAATVKQLRDSREPVLVYSDDTDSWVYKAPGMADVEREMLEKLDTQLLLPLSVKENLPGFISLGPKQSEEPYSNTDLRLLQSVATQTGLALENSQLTAAIASEVAQRERLNREVEIAREVQERLFPQNLPEIVGLDYSGACRPALGVGGDYYDFLLLPGGNFGIAIGDVSGKGIAAALLMASLQASLRGQAVTGVNDLAELMSTVNRLVYDASAENRYATFFYAHYEPQTRRLTYVNAGHNPPIILRTAEDKKEVLRLDEGGVVVGLLPDFQYQQASVQLEQGDLLIGFTDGISEAMNPSEEEWGEEKLIEAAKACDRFCAAEIINRLVNAADEFAAGAKQHDDMTLVVVRIV
ncbi:MAG TPA: SpoIIE family protein phosphatase [Pyrinomonadaceae bacterium]|nr:SpoIIE family protein phosphatase [Pyrinomonadaceae bacterium]